MNTWEGTRRWRFGQSLPLAVLSIRFLEQAGFVLLFVFLTQRYLADDRGLGVSFAGFAIAAFGLSKLMFHAPAGWLGDRIGYRRCVVLGLSVCLLAVMMVMSMGQAWALLLASALFGLGKGCVSPALDATLANLYDEEERGRVVAWMNAVGLAAYAVGGLSTIMVLDLGPPLPFFALSLALTAAALVVAVFGLEETATFAPPVGGGRPRVRALGALMTPEVAVWAAIVLMVGFGLGLVTPVARPYLRDVMHMELREIVPYLALPALLGALLIFPAGRMADRLGRLRPLAVGLGLGAIGMLGVSFTASVWAAAGMATLIVVSFALVSPSMGAALMDVTEEGTRGLVLGAFSTAGGLGGALGPAVGGRIYAVLTPQDVFFTAGFVLAGAMVLTVVYAGWRRFSYEPVAVPVPVLDD